MQLSIILKDARLSYVEKMEKLGLGYMAVFLDHGHVETLLIEKPGLSYMAVFLDHGHVESFLAVIFASWKNDQEQHIISLEKCLFLSLTKVFQIHDISLGTGAYYKNYISTYDYVFLLLWNIKILLSRKLCLWCEVTHNVTQLTLSAST